MKKYLIIIFIVLFAIIVSDYLYYINTKHTIVPSAVSCPGMGGGANIDPQHFRYTTGREQGIKVPYPFYLKPFMSKTEMNKFCDDALRNTPKPQ